jgi:hypothetical protein
MSVERVFKAFFVLAVSALALMAWAFYDMYQWMWGGL